MADPVSIGIQIGLMALSAGLNAMRKIEGPRLDNLKFNGGDYGAPLPRVWGTRWVSPPSGFAEDLREVKQRRKTKGGKFNDYTYFGTWSVFVACHEIAAVSRIKLDGHLVFDMTGAGPVSPFDLGTPARQGKGTGGVLGLVPTLIVGDIGGSDAVGFAVNEHLHIYRGTEDQLPDPRMLATIEGLHGEGACPAYRGVARIDFIDIPLEKFGNRIPQVLAEVVTAGTTTILTEQHEGSVLDLGWSMAKFSPDFSRLLLVNSQTSGAYLVDFEIWDVAARALIISGTIAVPDGRNFTSVGMYDDGRWLILGDQGAGLYEVSADGGVATLLQTFPFLHNQDGVTVLSDAAGTEHWLTYPPYPYDTWFIDAAEYTDPTWRPVHWFADAYGDIWGVFRDEGTSTEVQFRRVIDGGDGVGWPATFTVTGLPSLLRPECFGVHSRNGSDDFFVMQRGAVNYVIDPAAGTVVSSVSTGSSAESAVLHAIWDNIVPGAATYWVNGSEISLIDGAVLRTPVAATSLDRMVYDPITHALIQDDHGSGPSQIWHFVDRILSTGVTLGSVVEDIAALAGLAPAEIDASALTETIEGYSVLQGTGKDWLEILLDLYDVDARPHGFVLEFLPRGGAAGAEISSEDFAAPDGDGPAFSAQLGGGTDVPASLTLNFADRDADQQPNSALSGPLVERDSKRALTFDAGTLVLGADDAKQLIGRAHRRMQFDRRPFGFALPASRIALEPGDVHPLNLRGAVHTARLQSLELGADGRMATEWRADDPSVHDLDGSVGAPFDGRTPDVIIVPLISKGFVLDIPLLNDADSVSNPRLYIAAAPYAAGAWSGATIYQAVDGEYSDELGSVASSERATWGYATAALPDTVLPWVWDRGSSVNVMLQVGSLTGCTEAAIDANPSLNLALVGSEIVNFTTATLEGDGSYTLSGFKRGRRGTEWACTGHAPRDVFLLLDRAEPESLGLSEVGTDLTFKAVTSGRTASSAFPIAVAPFTGASLKPYAPCHLEAVKEVSGDWTLSWVRRTRVGGAWTSGTTIPLSEASEEYALTVGDGVTSDTKTVTSATSYLWTVAAQITDTGAEVMAGDLEWSIAQVSDAVGNGFLAEATA